MGGVLDFDFDGFLASTSKKNVTIMSGSPGDREM
jgi:hypothetical protein